MQLCACSTRAHPHAQHFAHCLAAHEHARAAAAAQQQQQQQQQRQRRRQRQQQQQHRRQLAMIGNGSNQHSHFSSTRSSVMPDRSALHRLQWNTRRFCIRFMSAPPASRVSLYSRSSHQCTCHLCHAVCCVGVTHFGFAVAAGSSTAAEGQPSQISFAVVIPDFRGTAASSIQLPHA